MPGSIRDSAGLQKTVKNRPQRAPQTQKAAKTTIFSVKPLYTAVLFPYDNYKTGQKCFKPACGAAKAAALGKDSALVAASRFERPTFLKEMLKWQQQN